MTSRALKAASIAVLLFVSITVFSAGPGMAAHAWEIETVDSEGSVGFESSMALDSFGNPHIAYFDATNLRLRYASWTGVSWQYDTIDSSLLSVNLYPSLALDSKDTPYVSYFNAVSGELKLATRQFSAWSTQTVDAAGNVGAYCSLSLDPSEKPHISYYDSTNGDLKYASWNGEEWVLETIDSEGMVGSYTSLAIDATGTPFISYHDITNGDLKCATKDTAWKTTVVDRVGNVGLYTSLALDPSGNPRISYFDLTNVALKYAAWDGDAWNTEVVETGILTYYTSLALDRFGVPSIACWDATNMDLRYAKWDGSAWEAEAVDTENNVGMYPSLTLDAFGKPHVSYYDVTNADLKYAYVATRAAATWYLAEGTTAWGFSTYLTVTNPNDVPVTARLTYYDSSGVTAGTGAVSPAIEIALPAFSQTTVEPSEALGQGDFSTKVECLEGLGIAFDRTMFWTGEGASAEEAHSSIGVNAPAINWYLPEGSSNHGFETWTLMQNPTDRKATVTLTYMIEGEEDQSFTKIVPPRSRATFSMEEDIGAHDASVEISSDIPVIAEHAVYRDNRRGGSSSVGATSASERFYLAEGTTAWGFTTYILLQNPGETEAEVTMTYMTELGQREQDPFTLPARSRKTINVNENEEMKEIDFSTRIDSTKPIVAERAMYWNSSSGQVFQDSIGLSSLYGIYYLPDGESSGGTETFTLIQNPNDTPVEVSVTYLSEGGGTPIVRNETIPAASRVSYKMLDHSGITGRASTVVRCLSPGKGIMVERSMYWNDRSAGAETVGGIIAVEVE